MPKSIQVVIQSPRGTETCAFEVTAKVAEVIEAARTKFGFEPGGFVLKREVGGETLSPNRPLTSYHLEENEVLLLVPEMGSGV